MGLRASHNGYFLALAFAGSVAPYCTLFVIGGRLDIVPSLRVCCIILTTCKTTYNKFSEKSSLLDSTKRIFENKQMDAGECQAAQSWIDEQLNSDLAHASSSGSWSHGARMRCISRTGERQ